MVSPVNPVSGGTAHSVDAAAEALDNLSDDVLGLPEEEGGEEEQEPAQQTSPDDREQEPESDDSEVSADDAGEEDEQQETPSYETLSQLQEALGSAIKLDDVQVTLPAAGEEHTVTLAELQKGYQRDADYRRSTAKLAETTRQQEAAFQQQQQALDQRATQLGQVLNHVDRMFAAEENAPEMQALRSHNPAEWTARRAEIQNKRAGLRQLFDNVASNYAQSQHQLTAAHQQQMVQTVEAETGKLLEAIPDWTTEESSKINTYLANEYGFTNDELNNVYDHRHIVLARKAMKYDQMQKVGKKTKQKVAVLPKTQAPSKGQPSKSRGKMRKVGQAQQKLKKSGNMRDAADLLDLKLKDL